MYKSTLLILFILLSCYRGHAQMEPGSFAAFSRVPLFDLMDVKLQKNIRIGMDDKPYSLFVFLSPECPLCQNYTSTLNQLQAKFMQKVNLYGIIPGNAYSISEVAAFENEYKTSFSLLIDAKQILTRYLKAAVTPQAILLDARGNLLYSGAIDDWAVSPGRKKMKISRQYVAEAIEQSLQSGIVKIKKTKAVGCRINDY